MSQLPPPNSGAKNYEETINFCLQGFQPTYLYNARNEIPRELWFVLRRHKPFAPTGAGRVAFFLVKVSSFSGLLGKVVG